MQCMYANAKAPNDLTANSTFTNIPIDNVCMQVDVPFGFKAHSDSLQLWDPARTGCMYMCLREAWRFHARGIHLLRGEAGAGNPQIPHNSAKS